MADAATAAALATATCYLAARRARDVDLLVRRLDHGDDAVGTQPSAGGAGSR